MISSIVTVECLDSTHDDRRTIVTSFVKIDGQGWRESAGSSARAKKEHQERLARNAPQTMREKLEAKYPADKPEAFQMRRVVGDPYGRHRYRLECQLCGITVPAREEKLFPILDRLVEAGASSITLAVLRATLGKH